MCSTVIGREWRCGGPSVSCCWGSFSSTASRVPSLLQAVRRRACSLDACPWMPAGAMYYCTFCTVRLRMFSLFFVFVVMSYGSAGKKSACNVGDLGSIPGLGRSPGEGKGYPLQYSGLEHSMDCIVRGVAKRQTRLKDFHFHFLCVWKVLKIHYYYVANCVSWVPRLTLLDLRTNWTHQCALRTALICRGLTVQRLMTICRGKGP